jgi:phage recombination protein Bet
MSSAEVVPIRQAQLEQQAARLEAWTKEQRSILKQVYAKDLSDAELDFFENVCIHRNLDPFRGQIIPVKRAGRLTIQVAADGYRALADRKGLYGGMVTEFCGPDGRWRDEWLEDRPPTAARTTVIRKDFDVPVRYVARYSSYVQFDHQGNITPIWKKGPDFMLGKCSEVGALKRAFPDDMPGRVLEPQSRMSMEARAARMDDDGRHALAAQVSNGRTESTRELNDDEEFRFRATVAAARADADMEANGDEGIPEDVDPETGEIVTESPPWAGDQQRRDNDRRGVILDLKARTRELAGDDRAAFDGYLKLNGLLGKKPSDMSDPDLHLVSAWFTSRRFKPAETSVPPTSETAPPSDTDAGASSQEETAGNPVSPDRDPRPSSWEQPTDEAKPPAIRKPRPTFSQQIAEEFGVGMNEDDVKAFVWATLGRPAQPDKLNAPDRKAVLETLRKYSVGDVDLDFTEAGVPFLKENEPF